MQDGQLDPLTADGAFQTSANASAVPPVSVRRPSKRYGDVMAVDGLSFTLERGTITGFRGPNGASGTTTLRMLLGLAEPSTGEARMFGRRYLRARAARPRPRPRPRVNSQGTQRNDAVAWSLVYEASPRGCWAVVGGARRTDGGLATTTRHPGRLQRVSCGAAVALFRVQREARVGHEQPHDFLAEMAAGRRMQVPPRRGSPVSQLVIM